MEIDFLGDVPGEVVSGGILGLAGYALGRRRKILRWLGRKPPVAIHVETNPEIIYANMPDWVTFPQYIPLSMDSLPPPPIHTLALAEWAKEMGGYPAYFSDVQITVRAWDDLDVIVDALRVKASSIELPQGVVVLKLVGGASIQRRQLDVELNTFATTVTPRENGGEPVSELSYHLEPGEPYRFLLHVQPSAEFPEAVDAYEWTASLDLLVGNKRKTVEISNNGKPFNIVNRDRFPEIQWTGSDWDERAM